MQDMAGSRSAVTASTIASSSASEVTSSHSFPTASFLGDSDFETEPDPPDWRESINQEELNQLNPRERKRQDVINGRFLTLFSKLQAEIFQSGRTLESVHNNLVRKIRPNIGGQVLHLTHLRKILGAGHAQQEISRNFTI